MVLNGNHMEKAVALFSLNVKLFPSSGNAWDSLGEAQYETANYTQAKISFEKALALKPN